MKDIQKVFSNNLKRFLNYNNKTQEDLAKDLHIHRSVVSTWCRGTAFPRADKIMLLSNYFNVDFIELSNKIMDLNDLRFSKLIAAVPATIIISKKKPLLRFNR